MTKTNLGESILGLFPPTGATSSDNSILSLSRLLLSLSLLPSFLCDGDDGVPFGPGPGPRPRPLRCRMASSRRALSWAVESLDLEWSNLSALTKTGSRSAVAAKAFADDDDVDDEAGITRDIFLECEIVEAFEGKASLLCQKRERERERRKFASTSCVETRNHTYDIHFVRTPTVTFVFYHSK